MDRQHKSNVNGSWSTLYGVLAGLFLAANAQAALVVDFNDYSTGQLATQAGGAGLTGDWAGVTYNQVVSGDVSGPAVSAKMILPQSGGAAQSIQTSTSGDYFNARTYIDLDSPITGGTYWVSFVIENPFRSIVSWNATGPELDGDSEMDFFITDSTAEFRGSGSASVATSGTEFFIVARRIPHASFGGWSTFDMWVNPASLVELSGSSDLTFNTNLAFASGITSMGVGGYGSNTTRIDNVRIGTALEDVVNTIPEPASGLLLSLAGLLGLRRRK